MRILCFILLAAFGTCLGAQVGISDHLQGLYRIDQLPRYMENTVTKQFSSYDRTGGNDDGFSGTYSFLRKEGKDLVIAEMTGPGVINRIWTPTPSEDTIQFFFDGEEDPRISIPFIDLFSGEHFPFVGPLCGHEVGGYYCYLPIPYNNSCKVVLKGKMLFYHLQYRTFASDMELVTYSKDWSEAERKALEKAAGLWLQSGNNFLGDLYEQTETEQVHVKLKPGQNIRIFELEEGGRILGLEARGIGDLQENDNRLIIKARWDGEEEWALHAPIKDFFGYHFGKKSMQSLLLGSSGSVSYAYYPMPFSHRAILELEYLPSEAPAKEKEIGFTIYYKRIPRREDEGRFYAYWKREKLPGEGMPYEILPEIRQKGHFVGTLLNCQGLIPGSTGYFEGDDKAFIDGVLCIHGTGSEDYFNGGWYAIPDRWDMAHSLPLHGCLGYSIPMSRTGGYRHYLTDKLSFGEQFSMTIEHGPEGNRYPVDYSSIALFYAEHALKQEAPRAGLVDYPWPETLKYPAPNMEIMAFQNGRIINGERLEGRRGLILETLDQKEMLVKFRLEAPVDGLYRLSCSYTTAAPGPEIKFSQRQADLSDWIKVRERKEVPKENKNIGTVIFKEGYATVSIHVRGDPGSRLFLDHFLLDRNDKD